MFSFFILLVSLNSKLANGKKGTLVIAHRLSPFVLVCLLHNKKRVDIVTVTCCCVCYLHETLPTIIDMSFLPLRSRSRSGAPHWVYIILYHIFTIPKIYSLPLLSGSHVLNSRDVADSGHSVGDEASVTTYYIISIILVLLGGVFAGLTLGLMGQDEVYLKVISTSGSNSERNWPSECLT